jgi:hypothetical protein
MAKTNSTQHVAAGRVPVSAIDRADCQLTVAAGIVAACCSAIQSEITEPNLLRAGWALRGAVEMIDVANGALRLPA